MTRLKRADSLDSGYPMLAFAPGPEISDAGFVFLVLLHYFSTEEEKVTDPRKAPVLKIKFKKC